MEARRRIARICSHLRPIADSDTSPFIESQKLRKFSCVSASNCASDSNGKNENQESECVFCKIVRGESPALKVICFSIEFLSFHLFLC